MTINLDWSDGGKQEGFKPGGYLVEVLGVELRDAKSGSLMLNIRLGAVDFGNRTLCYDNIMLGGKGKGIGLAKLVALGVKKGQQEFDPQEITGRRAYAYVRWEEYKSKRKLAVSISYGSHAGYWLENERDFVADLQLPGPNDNVPDRIEYEDPFSLPLDGGDVPF